MNKILDYLVIILEFFIKLYFSKYEFVRKRYKGHWEQWEVEINVPKVKKIVCNIWFFKECNDNKPIPFCTKKLQCENW